MWDQVQFDHEMVYHQAARAEVAMAEVAMRSHSETQKETYNNVVQRATTGPAPGNRDSLAPVEPQRTFAVAAHHVLAPE